MGQRRHHYEVAFESWMRARRTPYVSVREVRKALLPEGAALRLVPAHDPGAAGDADGPGGGDGGVGGQAHALKSFDFVIYGAASNLLLEVKGRKVGRSRAARGPAPARPRLESWVTRDDIAGLTTWAQLFGTGFEAAFLFVYWCEQQPPDALFQEVFEHRGRWYALRAIRLDDYRRHMRVRSQRWGTVHLAAADFERLSVPFAPAAAGEATHAVPDSAFQPVA
ncbi:MAG: HYExAFE family protein [Planctomycetota bacterium]